MGTHRRVVIGLISLVAIAGCERRVRPPTAKVTKPAAATPVEVTRSQIPATPPATEQAVTKEPAVVPADTPAASPTEVTKSDSDTQSSAPAEKSTAPTKEVKTEEPPPKPERVAILTPGGPLLVDVRITVDGQPHTRVFDSLVKRVLEAGDSDGDEKPTWKELAANRTYFEKELQNAPAVDSRQLKTLIERYDENRDGQIQPAEAATWLGRDAGTSAKPFSIRSTRAYRPVPRATSQVWQLIDRNRDGRLSRDEIEAAPDQLLSFDGDDDRILAPAEMASLREQLAASGQQMTYLGRQPTHYAAIYLEPTVEIDRLHYLLSDLYAPQQDLSADSFSELAGLFKTLDADGNDMLDGIELADILSLPPHVEVSIAFGSGSKESAGSAEAKAKALSPEVAIVAQPSTDRAVLSLGNTRLILSAHNLAAAADDGQTSAQAANQSQIRLMVHDQGDALFEELDANADGRLGEREIAYCAKRFAESDRNGDGQLAGDEFPYSMIVAFLLAEPPNEQSFYVPPSSTVAVTSDKKLPTWFSHADLNGDGDVSRREFLGSTVQFDRLDADKDSYIGAAEAAL